MAQINEYPFESTELNDLDFLDMDWWDADDEVFRTKKIKGLSIKQSVESFLEPNFAKRRLTIGDTISTSRSLNQDDECKVIGLNGADSVVVTLPKNSTTEIAIGSQFLFYLTNNTSSVTFSPQDEDVVILSADDLLALDTVGAVVSLVKVALNTWLLTGKLA